MKNNNSIVVMTQEQQQELIESAVRRALQDYQALSNGNDSITKLLSAKETQIMLGCSATTLWRLRKLPDGGLYPVYLASHKVAYKLDDIEKYLESKKSNNK